MFTDYERAMNTLEEVRETADAWYDIVGEVNNFTVYEIANPNYDEYFFEVLGYDYCYIAINYKTREVKISSEIYDDSDKPDISELLDDFDYYFK